VFSELTSDSVNDFSTRIGMMTKEEEEIYSCIVAQPNRPTSSSSF
jgi:hypothetical protein